MIPHFIYNKIQTLPNQQSPISIFQTIHHGSFIGNKKGLQKPIGKYTSSFLQIQTAHPQIPRKNFPDHLI